MAHVNIFPFCFSVSMYKCNRTCDLDCQFGYEYDSTGCELCQCRQDPCLVKVVGISHCKKKFFVAKLQKPFHWAIIFLYIIYQKQ